MESRKCSECGKEFLPQRKTHYTCSAECTYQRNKRIARQRYHNQKAGIKSCYDLKTAICLHCGKEFVKERPREQLCSAECREARKRSNLNTCLLCGKSFYGKIGAKLCSTECRNEWRRKENRDLVEINRSGKKKHVSRLDEINRLAREAGLTYGQYMAKQYIESMRFEK